jgi:tetratricopeptide (TPR) repeat protein
MQKSKTSKKLNSPLIKSLNSLKNNQKWIAISLLIPAYGMSADVLAANSSFNHSFDLTSQSTYSRLRITLDKTFKPTWVATQKGFQLIVSSATLMDLGVPFGEEDAFHSYLKNLKDGRVSDLSVQETGEGVVIRGNYRFPEGAQTLASPAMEHFDFRQDDNGKFVIDFWYKKGPTLAEEKLRLQRNRVKQAHDEQANLIKREDDRKKAREKRLEEAKDALQFCDLPFDRSNTVLIKYRPDHPILNFSNYFPEHIPDHRFEYHEPKGPSEESAMVRLALKLSRENNHALVLKTIDFLAKQYPKSKHLEEMNFLRASSFYRLEMEAQGKEMLQFVSKNSRGTEVGLNAAAFLAVQAFKRQEWLSALDSFMTIRREFPDHSMAWLFRYGIAECLYQIRQHDQSRQEFEWVAKNAPKAAIQAEASFKQGDVYFERNQFSMAIQAYSAAALKFKDQLSLYPHGLLNLAESYFQLEEYKRAQDAYEKYLEVGRNQPMAWRASLRIAEIHALHQKMNPEIEKAFTDTINRHPMTSGAVIARLRVVPCGQHGGFDLAGIQRFIQSREVKEFEDQSAVYLASFKELVGLTEVRALMSFGEDEAAIKQGLVHLRGNPSLEVRKLIEKVMIGGIKRKMTKYLDEGNVYGAMAIYEQYGDYLPLPSHDPLADQLRMRLAQFSAEKGFKTLALKLIEPYRRMNEMDQSDLAQAIARSLNLEGITEQEERVYLEVISLWNAPDFDIENEETSNAFLAKLASIRDVSKYSFDRDLLKMLFYKAKKDYAKAAAVATSAQTSGLFQKLPTIQKAQFWAEAGEVYLLVSDLASAAKAFQEARLARRSADSAKSVSKSEQASSAVQFNYRLYPLAPSFDYLLAIQGETLEKQEKWKEAVALYTEAVENKIGGNRVLFAHARAVLKEGSRNSKLLAGNSLKKIQQSQDDDVWKNLAQKALEKIRAEGALDQMAKEGPNNEKRKQ